MKRIMLLALAAVMLFSLCSCESSDYKMAMMLLKSGEYESAEKMFTELGDFEDAPEKVLRCRYEKAKELVANEQYPEASEIFEALGEYRDCEEQVPECKYLLAQKYIREKDFANARLQLLTSPDYKDSRALKKGLDWDALTAFLAEKGEVTREVSESCFTSVSMADDVLTLEYVWEFTEPAKLDIKITLTLDKEEKTALDGTEHYEGFEEAWDATASASFDLAKYQRGTETKWEKFEAKGYSANGEKDNEIKGIPLKSLLSTAISEMTYHLESALEESQTGVTMKDLGFAAY